MHWKEWLLEQRQKSGMVATKIPLKEVGEPWGMQADGSYGRSDSSFFKLVGLKVTANREVSFWHWPILEEAGGQGAVVVFRADNLY